MLQELCAEQGLLWSRDHRPGTWSAVCEGANIGHGRTEILKLFHIQEHAEAQARWMREAEERKVFSVPRVCFHEGRVLRYPAAFGDSLDNVAKHGLTDSQATQAVLLICSAVFAILSAGMSHGDMQARNIILDLQGGECRIIDPAQTSKLDDVDTMISALSECGLISQQAARQFGCLHASPLGQGQRRVVSRGVINVLSGLLPEMRLTARRAKQAARGEVGQVDTPASGAPSENLTASPTERQEEPV